MAKKDNQLDPGTPEARELIKRYTGSIQSIQNRINQLNEEKKDAYKAAKGEGLNTAVLKKVIMAIRKAQKAKPETLSEEEIYMDVLAESGIVY